MRTIKYKNILKSLLMGCTLLAATACDDYLDITPPSSVSPETYLVEESQLAAYTIKYYTDNFPSLNNLYGAELATDNATTRSSNNRYLIGEWKVGASGGDWEFNRIYEMNYFINNAEKNLEAGIIKGDATNIKHYIGEGYFIRAYQYFYRMRKLGDFPIVKEVLPDNQEVLAKASERRPRNEVARFILEDLDKAISYLTNNPDGGKARITKNAALVLKARVALFEATWEKYHAGTALVPNGSGWPGAEKEYNKGYQFPSGSAENEVAFFLDQAIDASKQVADAVQLTPNNSSIQQSASEPANDYYDMFASTNPNGYSEVLMYRPYSRDLSIGTDYNHHLYYGYARGYTHQMEQSFLMKNGLPVYAAGSGYKGDDYIGDTKIDRDDRWRLFMKAPGEVKTFINSPSPEKFSKTPEIYTDQVKYSTATGYLIGKGYSHDLLDQDLNKDQTAAVMFRAAEAYITYIEAYYEKNHTLDANADKYWRAIRKRAGVDEDYNKTIAATDMAKEALYDWGAYSKGTLLTDATLFNIRRERRDEFIGEGYRYDDLLRWRAMDQLNGFQIEGFKLWGPIIEDYKTAFSALVNPNKPELGTQFDKLLVYGKGDKENTISSPELSTYLRPYQVSKGGLYYNGLFFCQAHYLSPIALSHFLITASDGETVSTSPIYQNPGWPIKANEAAER
ncbi:RagB/SusD family nutrient uptake outer membrane protein [Bacteroides helcogenes]|uniref:RagB/SusD domain protein n=1 Tax=Bacteroides helcogenes (strain ATCC 35417 / DSM 20613 / JCM 6297 / CCUG 15421 / P 36-108) TaxID=693979 RepID=E6SWM3_BACT6|nr:RagB/SusD family nutrient uptake outer membrane protein [Bacteroides helcogenes]ADV42621.1 RagB/SusD domain protein [Bacteroides helcogenes P 36-108]MDY5239452.1 RagB/SusD family nutrient uptake outer membrane protein [Bacteroides helcogenes]